MKFAGFVQNKQEQNTVKNPATLKNRKAWWSKSDKNSFNTLNKR